MPILNLKLPKSGRTIAFCLNSFIALHTLTFAPSGARLCSNKLFCYFIVTHIYTSLKQYALSDNFRTPVSICLNLVCSSTETYPLEIICLFIFTPLTFSIRNIIHDYMYIINVNTFQNSKNYEVQKNNSYWRTGRDSMVHKRTNWLTR